MSQSSLKRVILDVDPGLDDAFAILFILYAATIKKVKIEAITISHGNGRLPDLCKNVVRILELVNRTDIPVYAGASEPLITSDNPYISTHFGSDGFCDIPHEKEPNLKIIRNEVAAVAINDIVSKNPGEISLICLGPLTNIALAFKLFSSFALTVKEIFILGGNIEAVGNTPTSAEFNFYMDPEAAHIVLRDAKCPITILPYETVLKSPIDINWRFKELATIKSPIMEFLNKVDAKFYSTKKYSPDIWAPFDVFLTAAIVFPNEIVTVTEEIHTSVELTGTLTRGQMVLDHRRTKTPNVTIIKNINVEAFKKILYDGLSNL